MSRPKLLDLFAGAGGCSVGYHRAGFDVTGVDISQHHDYPYGLFVADALEFLDEWSGVFDFDAVHASPPCPRYSVATPSSNRDSHPDLIAPVRERLVALGVPYVIENVPGAPLIDPVNLCGSMFGLQVRRHRLFESNVPLSQPACRHKGQRVFGVPAARRQERRCLPAEWWLARHQGPGRRTRSRSHGHRLDDRVERPRRRNPARLHRAHRPATSGRNRNENCRMTTSTTTHTQTLHEWKTVTPTGRRWRYRHRCTCGKRDPERYDIREAELDRSAHAKEIDG